MANSTPGGPGGGRNKPGLAERQAARRQQAVALKRAGMDNRSIAQQLGCSSSTVHEDLQYCLEETAKQCVDETRLYRAIELERMDRLMSTFWAKATCATTHPDPDTGEPVDDVPLSDRCLAADRVIQICRDRRKLLCLDVSPKLEVKLDVTDEAQSTLESRLAKITGEVGSLPGGAEPGGEEAPSV